MNIEIEMWVIVDTLEIARNEIRFYIDRWGPLRNIYGDDWVPNTRLCTKYVTEEDAINKLRSLGYVTDGAHKVIRLDEAIVLEVIGS